MGVALFDSLVQRRLISGGEDPKLTRRGTEFADSFGIDLDALSRERRPLCRRCLDWSMRRHHLAGALGAALLRRLYDLNWTRRVRGSRALQFTPDGERSFWRLFRS